MDTNTVLAPFSPKDPLRDAARRFFSSHSEKIISPISIVEMNSVLSRGSTDFDVPEFLAREAEERKARALSEYFVKSLGLRIESLQLTSNVRFASSVVTIPLEYSEALKQATGLRLRTLDLLHLAYATLLSALRLRVDNFVTSDGEILERDRQIQEHLGFHVLHPRDALKGK